MNAYPDITLQMEYSSTESYTEELKTKEAVEEFPDIFEIDNPYMFESAGKLGVIDESIGKLVENPVRIEGEIYALPFYSTSYGIVYNQVLFKKYGLSVPNTYKEFLEVCKVLKQNQVAPLAIGGNENSVESGWIIYFFLTQVESRTTRLAGEKAEGRSIFCRP